MYFWLRQLQGSMESTEGKKEEHTPKRRSGGGGKNSHGSMNQGEPTLCANFTGYKN